MPIQKSYPSNQAKLKKSTSDKSENSWTKLSIEIKRLKEDQEIGYRATIKELNANIMADSIEEIFELIPSIIDINKKTSKTFKQQTLKQAIQIHKKTQIN